MNRLSYGLAVATVAVLGGWFSGAAVENPSQLAQVNVSQNGQFTGAIISVGADRITLGDGTGNAYSFLVTAGTRCGRDNALSISDLTAGQMVSVVYVWTRGLLPTAVRIIPAVPLAGLSRRVPGCS